MTRFMHVSDTHLGAKEYSMDVREQDVYDSFVEAIDIAIEEKVDFVVHSGDLFDVWSPSNRALSEFKNGARRLNEHGIPVYLIMGDHDRPKRVDFPAARIFDFLGIELLGLDGYEDRRVRYGGEEILIGGISNIKGLRINNLLDAYRKAESHATESMSSILLSHQAITPYFFPPAACEADRNVLPSTFSYLAFGHVHDSFVDRTSTTFSYAGSTEIASVSEIDGFLKNGKSVNIIDLDRGNLELERRKLNSVRYQFRIRDATPENYMDRIEELRTRKKSNDKRPVLSLTITGDCDTQEILKELKKIDDFLIRFPVSFQKENTATRESVESKMANSIADYLERYFGSKEKAGMAVEVMKSLETEDPESMYRAILQRFNIEFMEDSLDN